MARVISDNGYIVITIKFLYAESYKGTELIYHSRNPSILQHDRVIVESNTKLLNGYYLIFSYNNKYFVRSAFLELSYLFITRMQRYLRFGNKHFIEAIKTFINK